MEIGKTNMSETRLFPSRIMYVEYYRSTEYMMTSVRMIVVGTIGGRKYKYDILEPIELVCHVICE